MELYKKYRPDNFDDVIGQNKQVKVLQTYIENGNLPHAILFTGSSGCGKTTLARILARELGASESEINEINCADFRGIDTVREIRNNMQYAPMQGKVKVWIIDETHMGTKDFHNAFLKILEDPKPYAYFFLCTTDPGKLLKTTKTRCTEISLDDVSDAGIKKIIKKTLRKEEKELAENVIEQIIKDSMNSPRAALVILDKVIDLPEEDQLEAAKQQVEQENETIELCRALINKKPWKDIAGILKGLNGEPESIRYAILAYANTTLLSTGSYEAYKVIDCFSDNFYDSKKAGLTRACYEVING